MKKPIVIANCSGAQMDQGIQMARQIKTGYVDAVFGDYLAEMNLADNARAYRAGKHQGWEKTAEEGILLSLPIVDEIQKKENRTVKIIVNGGALNPKGLAELIAKKVSEEKYNLNVAYVLGDELIDRAPELYKKGLSHLDSLNKDIKFDHAVSELLEIDQEELRFVSCNAYLGARAILKGLEKGADIIICGRVSDASPVIALASWWHNWSQTDYDSLAGALVAGHLSECSAYTTGANFSDFWRYEPREKLIDIGLPIVEIEASGEFVVTKHEALKGIVNVDTCRCQFLYELQGNEYLNSDVKALLDDILIKQEAKNRVRVSGIKGRPPPETTKLALYWDSGYHSEIVACATGTPKVVEAKFDIFRRQIEQWLHDNWTPEELKEAFDTVEFQTYAKPEINAKTQVADTSFFRIVCQSRKIENMIKLSTGMKYYAMQHYSGAHFFEMRSVIPKEINSFFPALIKQTDLHETVTLISPGASKSEKFDADRIQKFEHFGVRASYETPNPVAISSFGKTVKAPLAEVVLARSGDKGSNSNIGLFVHTKEEFDWLRTFFTCDKLKELVGDDWKEWFYVERVEMPKIFAVHFVVYGILGRGVSSSARLDELGKGFADYILSKEVEIPEKFVKHYEGLTYHID